MVFEEYAQYYDLLYADKDYGGEAKYIDSLLKSSMGGQMSFFVRAREWNRKTCRIACQYGI